MLLLEWIVPLLIGSVALTGLARRAAVPYPAFLALGGAVLAVLPIGPDFRMDPDLALALFVAPILLDTAYDASIRDLRAVWLPIAAMALAAVVVTTAAVAVAAKAMQPDLPWAAAIALGAVVAPPDATAATTILRQVRPPLRIRMILEGESLLNDASALFIYRLAVGAVLAGAIYPGALLTGFVLVLPASLAAGWAISIVTTRIVERIEDVPSSIIIQFTFTIGIWMLAEHLQLSPVLTIVAYAMVIARRPRQLGARMRLPAFAVWESVTFTLNVLAFVLIGLQLRPILEAMPKDRLLSSLGFALAVLGVCVLSRLGWVTGYQFVRLRPGGPVRRGNPPPGVPASVSESLKGGLVVGWSGMRGIVTLAAAFALPDGRFGLPAFPHRDLMLLTAFTVVLGTLVIQGLTLGPMLRRMNLGGDDIVGGEIGRARTEINRAALAEIEAETGPGADILRDEYSRILQQAEEHPQGFAPALTEQDTLRLRTIEAARRRLFELRAAGEIGNDAFQAIEFELDRAEMHATEV